MGFHLNIAKRKHRREHGKYPRARKNISTYIYKLLLLPLIVFVRACDIPIFYSSSKQHPQSEHFKMQHIQKCVCVHVCMCMCIHALVLMKVIFIYIIYFFLSALSHTYLYEGLLCFYLCISIT